jgi:hypothetical protein
MHGEYSNVRFIIDKELHTLQKLTLPCLAFARPDVHASFFHTLDQTAAEPDMSLEERLMASHVRRGLRVRRNAVLQGCHILYRGIAAEMSPLGPLFGATTLKDEDILKATRTR